MTNPEETENNTVSRVAVKLPEFISSDPELWFAMVEGSFIGSDVKNEKTKFGYIIAALPPKFATEVKDIILKPPTDNPYTKLREELIKRLSATQEEKTKQLLEREEIGDRKPSQFLRHLQNLADTNVPETLLKTLWMSRLPSSIQIALTLVKNETIEKLAAHADNILEASRPTISQISETSHSADITTKLSQLALSFSQEIAGLRQEIATLRNSRSRTTSPAHNNHSRSRSRSHSRTRAHDTCWYHYKFGKAAKNCQQPCKFSGKDPEGH